MRNFGLVAVLVGCVLIAGCQSKRTQETKEGLAVMESLQPQLAMYMKVLEQYQHVGIAQISMRPSGGRLFINGGEYLGDEDEIVLPVGAYEFKAVWNDGRQVKRPIFVERALGSDSKFNMDWKQTDGQLKWKISPDQLDINKTPVDLVRP